MNRKLTDKEVAIIMSILFGFTFGTLTFISIAVLIAYIDKIDIMTTGLGPLFWIIWVFVWISGIYYLIKNK